MKKQTKSKEFPLIIKKSQRARQARLAVYSDCRVVLTLPRGMSKRLAEKLVEAKADWLVAKLKYFAQFKDSPFHRYGPADYLKYRDQALRFVLKRVKYFNKIYNFSVNKVSVRDQRTCWGSCTNQGNLSFNYKIFFLPKQLADYLIVHELCHLKELNHSKRFWQLMARAMPNYQVIRQEFKDKGYYL